MQIHEFYMTFHTKQQTTNNKQQTQTIFIEFEKQKPSRLSTVQLKIKS